KLPVRDLIQYEPAEHPRNNDTVENKLVQFLLTKTVVTKTICSGDNNTTYLVGARKLEQLCPNKLYDIRNFCKEKIDPEYFKYPAYKNIFREYASERFGNFRRFTDYE